MQSAERRVVSTEPPSSGERADATPKIDARRVYDLMAKARALEERLVKMAKSSDGYFWIGGPGEEAFNVPLGLLTKKGEGPAYDYLHLHYRSSAILLAMGMEMIDAIRQMASKATDPHSGGRNFVNHFAVKKWNVVPCVSTIETQYAVAPGTALAQLRHGGDGITIVNGGDAGAAEGDFATCLNFATRPGRELPILILVTNNGYGISTRHREVCGHDVIAKRADAYGIQWNVVDGNDPVASWDALVHAMNVVRRARKPYCLEARVSRLHGHSSSSGGGRVDDERDCLVEFGAKLARDGIQTETEARDILDGYRAEALGILERVRGEPEPDPSTIQDHIFQAE